MEEKIIEEICSYNTNLPSKLSDWKLLLDHIERHAFNRMYDNVKINLIYRNDKICIDVTGEKMAYDDWKDALLKRNNDKLI